MQLLRFGLFICFSVFLFSCKKKTENTIINPPKPSAAIIVKRTAGQATGAVKSATIGASGGTLQSEDGHLTITVPAGAVNTATEFSIQPITNSLQTKALAYRIKSEGVAFKKDVMLTYSYAGIDIGTMDSKYLFLTYQDKQGYYHEAGLTKNNSRAKTLSVPTKHFSDWTFFSRIEISVNRPVQNGTVYLKKNNTLTLQLHWYKTNWYIDGPQDPYADTTHEKLLDEAWLQAQADDDTWSVSKPYGTIIKTGTLGQAIYTAPATIPQQISLLVTATIDGLIGADNEGHEIRQMQLSQPVVLEADEEEFFEVTVDGSVQQIHTPTVDVTPGLMQFGGSLPDGSTVTIQVFGSGTGSFDYGAPGAAGKVGMQYTPVGSDGFIHFHPVDCTGGVGNVFSPGNFTLTKIAATADDYTEGSFTATLYKSSWCASAITKNVSGRFKVKKQ